MYSYSIYTGLEEVPEGQNVYNMGTWTLILVTS